VAYYFHSGGKQSGGKQSGGKRRPVFSLNDGVLEPHPPPPSERPDRYTSNPLNPLPTIGGDDFGSGMSGQGPRDQRSVEARSLTYTTERLSHEVEVSGAVTVVLYASSSAVDTDFVATICDVHPDGYSQILRSQILRASYRGSLTKPSLLKPGRIYRLTFKLYPISNAFKAGHHIRINISDSSYPKWIPNPNSGRRFGEDTPIVTAVNLIYHDRAHPSHVRLPVVPVVVPDPPPKK